MQEMQEVQCTILVNSIYKGIWSTVYEKTVVLKMSIYTYIYYHSPCDLQSKREQLLSSKAV